MPTPRETSRWRTGRLAWARFAVIAAMLLSACARPARAIGQIDAAHLSRDRQRADACILRGVIIYTDPYISRGLAHRQIVAAIADMCGRQFAIYAEDGGLDAPSAQRLLRQTIEAGLRGQFNEDGGAEPRRDIR